MNPRLNRQRYLFMLFCMGDGPAVTADETSVFTVLDKVEEKRRGMGAIICTCPQPNLLRDNLLQLPVWYV